MESAGEGTGLGAGRESYTIRAVQMPKVQDRVRVRSQVAFCHSDEGGRVRAVPVAVAEQVKA